MKSQGAPEETLAFSAGWLQKFKRRNGIQERNLQREALPDDLNVVVTEVLPLLKSKYVLAIHLKEYTTRMKQGVFYRLEPNRTLLATQRLSGCKEKKE